MKKYLFLVAFAGLSISLKAQNQVTITDTNAVYTAVEQAPDYPGGLNNFYNYLAKTIRYPANDWKNHMQGKVFVTFVVEKDGSLSGVTAMRAPSATLGAEGVRVVSASPKWIPGMQDGKKVRVQYTLPINFKLN